MKKLIFVMISSIFSILQLHSISLTEYIQENGMPEINQYRYLNLSHKNLTDLTGLQNIPNIDQATDIYLSDNQLQTLPSNIFNGLTNLKTLDLRNNQLQALPSNIFKGLTNLNILDLCNNQLQILPDDIFNGLHNLGILYLNNNQIQTLSMRIFNSLCNLRKLYLNSNQLQKLSNVIFNGLDNLMALYLANNQLQTLPIDIFNDLNYLRFLNLQGNCFSLSFISKLTEMVNNIPNLERLNNQPKDEALKKQPFSTLKGLIVEKISRDINAYHHRLHELPQDLLDLFDNLIKLENLQDISNKD